MEKQRIFEAGLIWKNRANQERSGPTEGGPSLLDGDGEAVENSESKDLFVCVLVRPVVFAKVHS